MQYKAFLSYSHSDERAVSDLHRRLEAYRIPAAIVQRQSLAEDHLRPIFRDRDELSAGSSLSDSIQAALGASEWLIVACSPAAVASHWVDQEIQRFKATRGAERVLAVIVGGERDESVFPEALKFETADDGSLDRSRPLEPLAADYRSGGDGPEAAVLKLISTMLGVRYDELADRAQRARQRRLRNVAIASTVGMVFTLALAGFAWTQRNAAEAQRAVAVTEREAAERERAKAERVVEFLTDTFRVADPATENPDNISARQILDRGLEKLDSNLEQEPEVLATLLETIADVYGGLGLLKTAETAMNRALLVDEAPGVDRARRLVRLALLKWRLAAPETVEALLESAAPELTNDDESQLIRGRIDFIRAQLALQGTQGQEALNFAMRALQTFAAQLPEDAPELVEAYATVSNAHRKLGQFDRAALALDRAIELQRQHQGDRHSRTAAQLQRRATLRLEMDQPDQAAADIGQALAILHEILGESHPTLATAYFTEGRVLFAMRDSNAAQSFATSLQMIERHIGARNQFRMVVLTFASAAAARNGNGPAAFEMLDVAETLARELLPAGHAQHGFMKTQRGVVYGELGDQREAAEHCKLGIAMMKELALATEAHRATALEDCAPWLPATVG